MEQKVIQIQSMMDISILLMQMNLYQPVVMVVSDYGIYNKNYKVYNNNLLIKCYWNVKMLEVLLLVLLGLIILLMGKWLLVGVWMDHYKYGVQLEIIIDHKWLLDKHICQEKNIQQYCRIMIVRGLLPEILIIWWKYGIWGCLRNLWHIIVICWIIFLGVRYVWVLINVIW